MRNEQRMNKTIQLRSANDKLEYINNRSVSNKVKIASLTSHKKFYFVTAFLLTLSLILFAACLYANPTGGNVVAGQATIAQTPNLTTIDQSSNSAIINWQTFSIANGETTLFNQPSASSIALNRVITNNPSNIFGSLKSNGQVWLINPYGILFGKNATVNVGGLLATTADIQNNDFMSGNYHFVQGPGTAHSVINQGMITAKDAGLVALVAPGVENDGVIKAKYGKVTLASGNEYTVDLNGDQLISLAVTNPVTQRAIDADGQPITSAVNNKGKIVANGGTVMMTANVAAGVVDNVINTSGIVQANTIKQHNGEILIGGGDEGTVAISGKLVAAGKKHGSKGGLVQITGKNIIVDANATINVSGDAGGGQVFIGGSDHGKGPLPNAQTVYVDPTAVINANAITNGDGGHIVAWSDEATRFYGTATANGGAEGGNGGWIETSGKWLDVAGASVSASAAAGGVAGTWLLDPVAVNITSASSTGGAFTTSGNTETWNPDGTVQPSIVSTTDITTGLNAGTNVTITTDDSGANAQAADITVMNPIITSIPVGITSTLTLDAADNININSGGTIANSIGGPGPLGVLNVTLIANDKLQINSDNVAGNVNLNDSIITPGGDVSITANTLNASSTSVIYTKGYDATLGNSAGNGGDVTLNLTSTTPVTIGTFTIDTSAGNGQISIDPISTQPGTAGTTTFNLNNSAAFTFNTLKIYAQGGTGGTDVLISAGKNGTSGGGIVFNSGDLTLTTPYFVVSGGAGGDGTSIGIATAGGNGGDGGSITFNSGDLTINNPYFNLLGAVGGHAGSVAGVSAQGGNGGNGGSLFVNSTGTTLITAPSSFNFNGAAGGQGQPGGTGGNGGSIQIVSKDIDLEGANYLLDGLNGGDGISGLSGPANGGAGGMGGTITLNASNSITSSIGIGFNLVGSTGGVGNNGGSAGASGNGGAVSITGGSGVTSTITSLNITATGADGANESTSDGSTGGNGANGGTITFHTGDFVLNSPALTANGGTGGNGSTGLTTPGAGGNGGAGGSLNFNNAGNVTLSTASLVFQGGAGNDAGIVSQASANGGTGGIGGNLTVNDSGTFSLNNPSTVNFNGLVGGKGQTGGAGGNGGIISIISKDINLTNATLQANAFNGGDGLTGLTTAGNGGMGGNGGSIILTASDLVTANTASLVAVGSHGGVADTGGTSGTSGIGGGVSITGTNGITFTNNSTVFTTGGSGADANTSGGNGGNILLSSSNTPGISFSLSSLVADGGASGGATASAGNAGNITINGTGAAPINLLSTTLSAAGGSTTTNGGTGGNAGSISINSANGAITLSNDTLNANGSAATGGTNLNGGNAKNITVTSTGSTITSTTSTYNVSGGAGTGTGTVGQAAQVIYQAPTVTLNNNTITSTGSGSLPGWVVFGDTINLINQDVSNAVNFSNYAVLSHPNTFTITDTGTITDVDLPPLSLFSAGNIAGMNYSITSNTGDISIATATKVDGTDLTLDSVTGNITVTTDLGSSIPFVATHFTAGNTITVQNVTTNGSQTYTAPTVDAKGNFTINNAGTTSTNNFTASGGVFNLFNSSQITTNGGSVNFNSKIESNTGAEGIIISPTGNGNVNINNLVGDISPLSSFTIPNANSVLFTSPVVLKGNFASTESTQFTTDAGASITTNGGSISIIGGTTANISLGGILSSRGIDGLAGTSGATGTAGAAGKNGGDVTVNGLTLTFSNSGIDASGGTGGTGGNSSSASAGGQGGVGGNGGSITVTTASAQNLLNTIFNSSGGNGGNGGSSAGGGVGGAGGKGGNAGTLSIQHSNILTLNDTQLLANGGVGGNAGSGGLTGAVGGMGGNGAALSIIGNAAGAALNATTASVISSAGGNAGSSSGLSVGAAGGNGGSLTILESNTGGNETFNGTTISSAGGAGSSSTATGGNGGSSGLVTLVTNNFTLTNSPINVLGGVGGAGSPAGSSGTTTPWNLLANNVIVTETGTNTFDFSNLSKFANETNSGNPASVSFTQDMNITTAELPPITKFFNPSLTGMNYTINSTGSGTGMGSVTVDPNEFANSLLTIQANNNITLTQPLSIGNAFGSLLMTATNGSVQMGTIYTNNALLSVFAGQDILINAGTSLVPTTIGSAGGVLSFTAKNGNITLGDYTTVDSGTGTTTFSAGNDITLGNNNIMNTNGSQLSVTAYNNLTLGNNDTVTTNNGTLKFASTTHTITLGNNDSLNSGTGQTTFNSGKDITLGSSDVITTNNSPITFNSNTMTAGNGITIGTLSKLISNGAAINLTSTSSNITLGDNTVLNSSIGGPINLVSGQNITLGLNSILNSDGGNITLNRIGNIELGIGSSITPMTGNISFLNGNLIILDSDYALTTNGGNIYLGGAITGTSLFQLTLDTGTGNITFNETVPPASIRSNILITNAKNVVNSGSTFYANTFTENNGTGLTSFTFGSGLSAADNVTINNLNIIGNYEGINGFLNGVNGDTARVNFHALVVDGLHGGQLTGNVNGTSGSDAALFTQLDPLAKGTFTMNGCLVGIGCDEEDALSVTGAELWSLLNPDQPEMNEAKPCTFDQTSGQTDMKPNGDCAPISVDKRLQITAYNSKIRLNSR